MIVTLFYKYSKINKKDLEKKRKQLTEKCNQLNIRGRILLAEEGINGSVSGPKTKVNQFKKHLSKKENFPEITFKDNKCDDHPFKKTHIRIRDTIINIGTKIDVQNKGQYITAEELKKSLDNKEELILLDARNDYESRIGKFKNAITPQIKSFRNFSTITKQIEKYKQKKIVMYCTGGIRCEKASALLKTKGFKQIYQLKDGILRYIEKYPDDHFQGRCFVFDRRVSILTGKKDTTPICDTCGDLAKKYSNCLNVHCDKLFLSCPPCYQRLEKNCSKKCRRDKKIHDNRIKNQTKKAKIWIQK